MVGAMQAVEKKPSERQAAAASQTPTQRQHLSDLKHFLCCLTQLGLYFLSS